MSAALPWLTLGLGVAQQFQSGSVMNQALAEARKPRFTKKMAAQARESGTSNIMANLAERGLLDSSLLPGGLADLEKGISEARASGGLMGNPSDLLWQQALGLGQSGGSAVGNIVQLYMLRNLFGGGTTPWTYASDTMGGGGGGYWQPKVE